MLNEQQKTEIMKLSDLSIADISRKLNIPRTTVRRVLDARGLLAPSKAGKKKTAWTEDNINELRKMYEESFFKANYTQIMERFKVTEPAARAAVYQFITQKKETDV